ncbi:diguanylate cyclase [Leptospira ellisii]|uniref:diguanylate cyclase n=3 Tax=Leptospira ellisii TaxID=2023197 RepID=A0AAE4QQK3_9LEPT|nr:sensor domain-containing diguanylate cyclase [Leptospira ellisii]MDV6237175.1 diguanylate cyclase [Leptospira ellisii]PKA03602.1 sensor domain-containing diguanylate cyclase [Leptospira ellisii]
MENLFKEARLKRRILFPALGMIPILMIGTFVYESWQLQNEIRQVVQMRARVLKDYFSRVSSQAKALGFSMSDYLAGHEHYVTDVRIRERIRSYPSRNFFEVADRDADSDRLFSGSLTGDGSGNSLPKSLIQEMEAALSLEGQFQALTDSESEVLWAYYMSTQKFIYIAPKTDVFKVHFQEEFFQAPFWVSASPGKNPERKQVITDLYDDLAGKGLLISVSQPVYFRDRFVGVAAIDIGLNAMRRILETGDCLGESMLIAENGNIVAKTGAVVLGDRPFPFKIEGAFEAGDIVRKDWTYWTVYEVRENEIHLVHKIQFLEYITFIIERLLPFWGLVLTLAAVCMLYVKLRASMYQVYQLSHTDPLTGITNRRGFLKSTQKSLTTGKRHGKPWSVLMIDIDHFKQVNDRYGHGAGDRILNEVAGALCKSVRKTDFVCRWGGEEFAVFLSGTGQEGAREIADHLRTEIQARVRLDDGASITISVGVAQGRGDDQCIESALGRADQALYQAKAGGRNKVCEYELVNY